VTSEPSAFEAIDESINIAETMSATTQREADSA
jgi:hypothetical protein